MGKKRRFRKFPHKFARKFGIKYGVGEDASVAAPVNVKQESPIKEESTIVVTSEPEVETKLINSDPVIEALGAKLPTKKRAAPKKRPAAARKTTRKKTTKAKTTS